MDSCETERSMKLQRKLRNKLRMRERRRDPEYKEKERQRQSELRASRSRSTKRSSSRTTLPYDDIPDSTELNQTQSNQPYAFMKIPEFYSNDVTMGPQAPQLSSPNAVPPFPTQGMPVAVPVLEAESMHEATCVVSIPSVSNKPQLPAVVRMAVMPPVPSIINIVIVPGNGGADGGAVKAHSTLPTQAGNIQPAAQIQSSNTTTSQILQLDDPADFICNSNRMMPERRKRFKPSEENSSCGVGKTVQISR